MTTHFLPCNTTTAKHGSAELLIVEGKSALSAVNQVRNRSSQAVLSLQGKIPNAETQSKQKILRNEQCQRLFAALDCDSPDTFELSKLGYKQVVILADPDPDGVHGQLLILQLIKNYIDELLQANRVRVVVGPRYRVQTGTPLHFNYFWAEPELKRFLNENMSVGQDCIVVFKGLGSLSSDELAKWVVSPQTRREIPIGPVGK